MSVLINIIIFGKQVKETVSMWSWEYKYHPVILWLNLAGPADWPYE